MSKKKDIDVELLSKMIICAGIFAGGLRINRSFTKLLLKNNKEMAELLFMFLRATEDGLAAWDRIRIASKKQ